MKWELLEGRYEREAYFLQALAHPIRLAIVDLLAEGPKCACEIEPLIPLDQSTISRHLSTLRRAGVLKARKDGVRVLYEVSDPRVFELRRLVGEILRARAEEDLQTFAATSGSEAGVQGGTP